MSTEISCIAGIRFSKTGKIYHFDASKIPDLRVGDAVIVETSRGWQLGLVAQVLQHKDIAAEEPLKPVARRATPRDLLLRQSWQQKEVSVVQASQQRVSSLGLSGIKVIAAEYSFDGSRLSISITSETEEKVDLKTLRQDMQKMFAPSQVEIRQIGPRDVARFYCGMGACGLETRCCCKFLTDFNSISIRMAKEQDISLTPSEITGMCGRLRCCLSYEYEQYIQLKQNLPKKNKWVTTPAGEGKVVDVLVLKQSVLVELNDAVIKEFSGSEVQVIDEAKKAAKKQTPVRFDRPTERITAKSGFRKKK